MAKRKPRRKRGRSKYDLIGKKYAMLTVYCYVSGRKNITGARWYCICDCGRDAKVEGGHTLVKGLVISCGCYKAKGPNRSHGLSRTSEYGIWTAMKKRCSSETFHQYHDYGGRGIKVCDRWVNSFENFHEDMGNRPSKKYSIERVDNDKGYSKGNCKWATRAEQGANKRTNVFFEYQGESHTAGQWAKIIGMEPGTLWCRLVVYGWSVEKALTTPLNATRKKPKIK